jgi:hypothetical protein
MGPPAAYVADNQLLGMSLSVDLNPVGLDRLPVGELTIGLNGTGQIALGCWGWRVCGWMTRCSRWCVVIRVMWRSRCWRGCWWVGSAAGLVDGKFPVTIPAFPEP